MEWIRNQILLLFIILVICQARSSNGKPMQSRHNRDTDDHSVSIKSRFDAFNLVSVTIATETQVQEPEKVVKTFILLHGTTSVKCSSVVDSSGHQPTSKLVYHLWLENDITDEIAEEDVRLKVLINLHGGDDLLEKTVNVLRDPDVRPPRISHLTLRSDKGQGQYESKVIWSRLSNSNPPEAIYHWKSRGRNNPTLTCHVENMTSQEVSFKWFLNGSPVEQQTATLQVNCDNHCVYQCQLETGNSISTSHPVHIYVTSDIKHGIFSTSKPRIFTPLESTVRLDCDIKVLWPYMPDDSLAVTWLKNGKELLVNDENNSTRILQIKHRGILFIKDIQQSDEGLYVCSIQYKYIRKRQNSTFLRIRDTTYQERPEVYKQNPQVVGLIGHNLTLFCVFTIRELIAWEMPQGITVDHIISDKTSRLTIHNVTSALNRKQISCRAGEHVKTFQLTVPEIRSHLDVINATVGDPVEIKCIPNTAVSSDQIHWLWNNEPLNHVGASYVIDDVKRMESGEYTCIHRVNSTTPLGQTTLAAATSLFVYDSTTVDGRMVINSKGDGIQLVCQPVTDDFTPLTVTWVINAYQDVSNHELEMMKAKWVNINFDMFSMNANMLKNNNFNVSCTATNEQSSRKYNFVNIAKHLADLILIAPASAKTMDSFSAETSNIFLAIVICGSFALIILVIVMGAIKIFKIRHKTVASQIDARSQGHASRMNSYEERSQGHPSRLNSCSESAQGLMIADTLMSDPFRGVNFNNNTMRNSQSLANNPKLKGLVIARDRIIMQDMIGKGQFGRVYKGSLLDDKGLNCGVIAIKTLKYKSNEKEMVQLFLREALFMKNFSHEHVLRLIGISEEIDASPLVVLPYMSRGDLRCYVLNQDVEITVLDLLKLGLQVAMGMEYLTAQKFVHRDLACRNCMVDENNCVKVADFGLSRDLFTSDYYRDSPGKQPLPVRWMAPECHNQKVFTMQSDVWSFGILLWELMTRGLTPYGEVENWQVPASVMQGNKLDQPEYCPDSVFEVMVGCWYTEPPARSAFPELVSQIEDIILTAKTGCTFDSERFYLNIQRPDELDYRAASDITSTSGL